MPSWFHDIITYCKQGDKQLCGLLIVNNRPYLLLSELLSFKKCKIEECHQSLNLGSPWTLVQTSHSFHSGKGKQESKVGVPFFLTINFEISESKQKNRKVNNVKRIWGIGNFLTCTECDITSVRSDPLDYETGYETLWAQIASFLLNRLL